MKSNGLAYWNELPGSVHMSVCKNETGYSTQMNGVLDVRRDELWHDMDVLEWKR